MKHKQFIDPKELTGLTPISLENGKIAYLLHQGEMESYFLSNLEYPTEEGYPIWYPLNLGQMVADYQAFIFRNWDYNPITPFSEVRNKPVWEIWLEEISIFEENYINNFLDSGNWCVENLPQGVGFVQI
jgi:hypothetical protein